MKNSKIKLNCMVCGKDFLRYASEIRKSTKRGHSGTYCSRSCTSKEQSLSNRQRKFSEIHVFSRFWSKVQITKDKTSCWNWTDAGRGDGSEYGCFRFINKSFRSHRFGFKLVFGTCPEGLLVMHKCDNPKCVRPSHLKLGSHLDNNLDSLNKGRRVMTNVGKGKFSIEEQEKVVSLFNSGTSKRKIREITNVSNHMLNKYLQITR